MAMARRLPEPLPLTELPPEPGPAAEMLRWWLLSRGGAPPPVNRLRTWWLPVVRGEQPLRSVSLPGGRLIVYHGALYWCRGGEVPGDFVLEGRSGERELSHGCLRWAAIDGGESLVVRFNRPGLYMQRGRGRATVRSLLQSAVLPWERARYPLICRGDVVLCIPGVASSRDLPAGRFEYLPGFPVLRPDLQPEPD